MATAINRYRNQKYCMYLSTLHFKTELFKRCMHIAHFDLLAFQQDSYNKQLQCFTLKFLAINYLSFHFFTGANEVTPIKQDPMKVNRFNKPTDNRKHLLCLPNQTVKY